MKTLRNFLVANVFALFPLLWIAFGWMPRQVKVEMRGNVTTPVAVATRNVVLQGQEHGRGKEGSVWKFYLRNGMQWNQLAFRLPEGMDERHVVRVWIEKWKLVALGKPGTGLQRKEGRTNDYVFANPRFEWVGVAQGAVPPLLAGVEVLILGVSWWCSKRHREERCKTLLPSVLGVAFALSLLMQVALPVQSCVSNQSAFPFTPWELCAGLAACFLLSLALETACLGVLSRCFGRLVLSLAFAFAVCVYLESGILSEGLPSLTGDLTFFADRTRGMKDAAVWCGVFAVVLGLHRWLQSWLGVAGWCMSLMSVAAMLDVKPELKADTSNLLVHDFSSVESVIRNATYSTNRNVMVFIVDSLETQQAHAIMEDAEAGPRLREQFRGFTEYTNNVGACEYSLPAVANMMTGNYPASAMDPDFYASVYAEGSVLKDYLEAGYAVYSGTTALGYGYTNRKQHQEIAGTEVSLWDIHSQGNAGWGLTAFCRFRWIPFIAKAPYARLVGIGRRVVEDVADRETTAYPILAQGAIAPSEKGSFLLLHTAGVHVPIFFNRHGEHLSRENSCEEGCIESGIFVLGQLGRLLDDYRERGLFDKSLIIVLADHGHHGREWTSWNGPESEFPGNARPFLWIKPPHCTHPFMGNGAPTTHARLCLLLKEALERDLDDSRIQGILSAEERVYRREAGMNWEDFHVAGDNGWHVDVVEQNEPDPAKMRPIQLGKMIALNFVQSHMREMGTIRFRGFPPKPEGGVLGWKPFWLPSQKRVSMNFKVPSQAGGYRIRLIGNVWKEPGADGAVSGRCLRFSARGNDATTVEVRDEGVLEVVLEPVVPDSAGIIEIVGEREKGCDLSLVFTQLIVFEN